MRRWTTFSLDLDFQGHRDHKGQIRFREHNSKSSRGINLNIGTDTCLGSSKIAINLGASLDQFLGHWSITQKVLRAINLLLCTGTCLGSGKLAIYFGVTGVNFWGLWSITQTSRAINLKLDTDTCLGSGKMPIHFGVTGVNFGVTECKKVKIAQTGVSCPTLWCHIYFLPICCDCK